MSQNKFLRIISKPLKALTKARDFYVRSLTGVTSHTHYSSSTVSPPFPRSKSSYSSSTSSRRATNFGTDEDYSELVRAASVRSLGHKNEIEMLIQEKKKLRKYGGLGKSSSLGMAIIEEEDEEGEEGSVNIKMKKKKKMNNVSDVLYPRSKSYAVTASPKF